MTLFISSLFLSKEIQKEREVTARRGVSVAKKNWLDWSLRYQTPVLVEPFNPVL